VAVDGEPPITVDGSRLRALTVGGKTISVADAVVPFSVAISETAVVEATGAVVTTNCAVVCPPGTTTVFVPGVPATVGLLLASEIASPPAGAGLETVTVATDVLPPITDAGATLRLRSLGAATRR
jgi:hypothetical protein